MNSIDEKVICGKRGGSPYVSARKVVPDSSICMSGYTKCSSMTQATDTVCVLEHRLAEDCPIIDIIFVTEQQLTHADLSGYTVLESRFTIHDGTVKKLAFSKDKIRKHIVGAPVMAIEINTQVPCFGNKKGELKLSPLQNTALKSFDYWKEKGITTCPKVQY